MISALRPAQAPWTAPDYPVRFSVFGPMDPGLAAGSYASHSAPNMPSLDVWNPNKTSTEMAGLYGGAGAITPATVGDQAFFFQYFPMIVVLVAIAYLLEKRRIRLGGKVEGSV